VWINSLARKVNLSLIANRRTREDLPSIVNWRTSARLARKLSRHGIPLSRGLPPFFACSFRRWTSVRVGKSNLILECYKVSFPILRGHGWFKVRRKGVLTSSNGSLYWLAFAVPIPLHPDLLGARSYELPRRARGTEFNIQAPESRKSTIDEMKSFVTVRCTSLFWSVFFFFFFFELFFAISILKINN